MDTESLLRSLRDRAVDFVVIGASAFPAHGYARATLDIDLFIRPEPENARRTLVPISDLQFQSAIGNRKSLPGFSHPGWGGGVVALARRQPPKEKAKEKR